MLLPISRSWIHLSNASFESQKDAKTPKIWPKQYLQETIKLNNFGSLLSQWEVTPPPPFHTLNNICVNIFRTDYITHMVKTLCRFTGGWDMISDKVWLVLILAHLAR